MGESAMFNGKHSIANEYFMERMLLTCCGHAVLLWRTLLVLDCGERSSTDSRLESHPSEMFMSPQDCCLMSLIKLQIGELIFF